MSASAAIQFQNFTEVASPSSVLSVAVPTPSGTSAGDLLIVAVATDGDSTVGFTPAPGWNLIDFGSDGAETLGVWWRLASGAEPPVHVFSWTASTQVYAWMMRFTGHHPVAPIDVVSAPMTGTSSSPTSPSVTTTVANTLVLRIGAFDDDDVTVDVTGLAGHVDITMDESSSLSGSVSAGAGYALQPLAGPSGTSAFAITDNEQFRTITLALAPGGAVTSAVAEIDPNTVVKATTGSPFSYDIAVTIGAGNTGVDEITIGVPPAFGLPNVLGVNVGGSAVSGYTDMTAGHEIRVLLDPPDKVLVSDDIQIVFEADAPSCPDELGRAFLSTVNDSGMPDLPQNTVQGDADGDGGDNNSWLVVTTGSACWYGDPGYQYRKRLCLDGAQISGELIDFPALVSLAHSDLSAALANGFDIVFTSDDGVTRLDYERVAWSQATGAVDAWVRFPRLVAGTDKTFYIYYGKPSELVDQQNPPAVWDPNYRAVWHLEENGDGSVDEFRDATSYNNHGRGGAGVSSETPSPTGGVIGNAQVLDGTNDFISIVKAENDVDTAAGTISAWLWLEPVGSDMTVLELRANASNEVAIWWDDSLNELQLKYEAGATAVSVNTSAVDDDGNWNLVTMTWDTSADELEAYVNGAQVGSTQTGLGAWSGAFNGLGALGAQAEVGHPFELDGRIDEARISSRARSHDWIQTCYANQSSPGSFLKCVDPEETIASGVATISSANDQTFVVGRLIPPAVAAQIAITDASGGAVTTSGDLRIRIPVGFHMRWDALVTGVALSGSAVGKVDPNVLAYEDSDRTVVLDVVTDFAAGDQILIDNLRFESFTAPSPPDYLELELGDDDIISAFDDKHIDIIPDSGPTLSSEWDQAFTVMQAPTPAATFFVTEGTASNINPTDEIIVRIPAGYPILWNTGIGTAVIGGSAAAKVSTAVGYEALDRGVIIDVITPFAPGDFITVSGLELTWFDAVAAPDNLELDIGSSTDEDDKTIEIQAVTDVAFFTATATDFQVELEWVSPPFGSCFQMIVVRRLGALPTPVMGDWFHYENPCPAPGTKLSVIDASVSNDLTYNYAVFVHDGATGYSPGKFLTARPFDSVTGKVKWAYSTGAASMAPPGLRFSGGSATVYAVSNDSVLHGINGGGTGGRWPAGWRPFQLGAPAQARPPVVPFVVGTAANGVALLGSQDGKVYAVNADTGSETWSQSIAPMVQAAPAGNFAYYNGSAHDVVLVGTRNSAGANSFEALHVDDGNPAWSFTNATGQGGDNKAMGIINGSAAVDYVNHRVFFASRRKSGGSPNTIWCVDFNSGSPNLLWANDVGNVDGSPTLWGGVLYVGTNAGAVYALDPATGASNWPGPLTLADGPIKWFAFPQFGTNNLLVSSTTNVWSIADSGAAGAVNVSWPATGVPSPSTPLFVPGTTWVLAGGSDGRLHQLDVTDPATTFYSVTLGDGSGAVGMPTMDLLNSMVYVGTDQGIIYGIEFPLP